MLKYFFISIFLVFAWTPLSHADDIELGGVVIDRTITRFGKDFFFYYTSYWRDIPSTDGLTVVIHERVYPQAGTHLWIELDQELIYQTYFGRRQNDVKTMAEQAIMVSINEVAKIRANDLLGSPDAPDL